MAAIVGRSRGSEGVALALGDAGLRVRKIIKRQRSAKLQTSRNRKKKWLSKKAGELSFKRLCSPYENTGI